LVLCGQGSQIRHLCIFVMFDIGMLPHSIRLSMLVTFFFLHAQNLEYSKHGCQF
jgi:hypothetical protein